MLANILNRPWAAPGQARALLRDGLINRRGLLGLGATALVLSVAACNGVDIATLTPTIVEYVTNIAGAFKTALAGLSSVATLPTSVSAVLAKIGSLVADISSVASQLNTSTLVSTAGGGIQAIVTDFNQIVQSIVASPVVSAALSATSFGWAVYAAVPLLTLAEQAVGIVVSIINPPTPTPTPAVPASMRMGARVGAAAAPLDPATANLILESIANGR